MGEYPLLAKSKALALRVMRVADALPAGRTGDVIGRQMIRSATSVGANYRSSLRAKSKADMLHKWKIVEEEADETLYWLELLVESNLMPETKLKPLMDEFEELLKLHVASIKTLRASK